MDTEAVDLGLSRMRALVDDHDWAASPLGARAGWPAELESTVQQVLDSHFPMALVWGPSMVTIYNDAFRPILGSKPEALGRGFADIWAEAWDQIGPIAEAAMEGKSTFIENYPLVINREGLPEQAYFTFCYSPIKLQDGTVGGMLDTVIETTSTVEVQASLDIANRELAHRLKNSLALVQSIASQTLRHHADAEAFASFESRLDALSHAHDVLQQQNWTMSTMRGTVVETLAASLDMGRVRLAGDHVEIGSKATMALSMMLHELATNATKYGAMSKDGGIIALSWETEGDLLIFRWIEEGGPTVVEPTERGFGTRLIRCGLGFSSKGELRFEPAGLEFEISVPIAELQR